MKINRRILFYALGILVIVLAFSAAIASGDSGPDTDPPKPPETETAAPPVQATEPAPNPGGGQDQELINPPLLAPGTPSNDLPGEVIQPTQQTDPPQSEGGLPQPQAPEATINAVVVRSYGGCPASSPFWDSLNTNWANFGSTQIHINYNYAGLCDGTITYANLAASQADVVILSDPAGGLKQYSTAEISAIQQYALEGHHLIGTYLLLQWSGADNRGLAPLFGLQAGLTYTVEDPITPTYTFLEATNPLFKRLPSPYASSGYAASQVPASGTWSGAALNGARIAGINANQKAAILSYHGPNYHATYITSMPEYNGGLADQQLIYNAITYDVIDAVVVRSWGGCSSSSLIWDSLNATWPSYGAVPIHIRYAAPGLCSGTITYAGLVASQADVVILDDPSGGGQQYSAAEINALQQYAQQGHNLIGTYALLQLSTYDNRGLAPLFGLQAGLTYNTATVTPTYTFLEAANPLFKHLDAPYASSGYNKSQAPASGTWTGAALNGARIVGINADQTAAVLVYDAPKYRALYITSMPEYGGGAADKQFFYNAIRYAVDAVVVRSWGGCSSGSLVWDSLNATSTDYGSFPVYINYNYRGLCDGTITHDALVDSRADVVILSDPAGGGRQYSAAEINDLQQYVLEGHHLVGTYAMLQNSGTDNRGLAPLFGLQAGLTYNTATVAPTYTFLEANNPLFKRLPSPYASSGFNYSQVPASGTWSGAALNGARIAAINANQKAAILSYHGPNYHATYITSMPEYGGGTADKQLIYNAITYDVIDAVVVRSWGGCSSGSLIWDSLNATWPSYGAVPIHIRYAAPGLCSGTITYAGLVASQADVVILNNPAGGSQQYSAAEINALQQYAQEGHHLIGTLALLQNVSTDNRGLAPLFGLQGGLTYTGAFVNPTYNLLESGNPLFRYLAAPYASSGWDGSQFPASGTWSGAALNGARYVGMNTAQTAAITVYDAPKYHAIYVTSMPEYQGGATDKQFFYNAILYRYQINMPFLRK